MESKIKLKNINEPNEKPPLHHSVVPPIRHEVSGLRGDSVLHLKTRTRGGMPHTKFALYLSLAWSGTSNKLKLERYNRDKVV